MSDPSICVIGAGQLGSRHLQSLATLDGKVILHAVDPSPEALELSRQRMGPAVARLHCHSSVKDLPRDIDVVVVATGATIRKKVVSNLLSHSNVHYLILEKILFQSVTDCLWARDFLAGRQTKVWVNFPRRVQPAYQYIHETVTPGQPMEIRVSGSRWGLATSTVHFLDLILFLTDHGSLTISQFEGQLYPSRHRDCFECTGYLAGEAGPGQVYSITAWPDGGAPMRVTIDTPENRWIVYEKDSEVVVIKSNVVNGWQSETLFYPMLYQSQLTGPIVDSILKSGTCGLSDYDTALKSHLPFLRAWNRCFAPDSDSDSTHCLIT